MFTSSLVFAKISPYDVNMYVCKISEFSLAKYLGEVYLFMIQFYVIGATSAFFLGTVPAFFMVFLP